MAYSKKYPSLLYKAGVKGRYGVSFSTLGKSQKRFLLEHKNLKTVAEDPQKLLAIMGLFRGQNNSLKTKLFYDWTQHDLKKINDLQSSYDSIEWHCAISGLPIKSQMGNFSAKNFVHPKYWDSLDTGINRSVLESSIKFRQKCQELLLNEQRELLKVFKKNANPRKRLE